MSRQARHPNARLLAIVYADLSRIADHVTDDVVLHPADPGKADVVGKEAVAEHELALIGLTGDTLAMAVEHIAANDHFGAVLGVLRAQRGGHSVAMPFCGLWRFTGGVIAEHWENAYDPAALNRFLEGEA